MPWTAACSGSPTRCSCSRRATSRSRRRSGRGSSRRASSISRRLPAAMLGLIGSGNMGSALARGLGEPVTAADVDAARAQALVDELGGEVAASNAQLAERADPVVLAHKPAQLGEVAQEIAAQTAGKLVISLLGGVPQGDVA